MKGEIWQARLKVTCTIVTSDRKKKGQQHTFYKQSTVDKRETELVTILEDKIVYLERLKNHFHTLFFSAKKNRSFVSEITVIEKIKYLGLTNCEIETSPDLNFKYEPFKNFKP